MDKDWVSFSVDDIREIRSRKSKKLERMTPSEQGEYFNKGAARMIKRLEELGRKKTARKGKRK